MSKEIFSRFLLKKIWRLTEKAYLCIVFNFELFKIRRSAGALPEASLKRYIGLR